jgi:hypothetical protein
MALGIICCRVLEKELKSLIQDVPEITRFEVMEWGLHIRPNKLLDALSDRIRCLQNDVDAIMLGYGRCQALDRLPRNFKTPVFFPDADDCIGVLLGRERYRQELQKEAGTWFLTPGWTEIGMEFVFHELQISGIGEKDIDPLQLARRLLKDFTRGLFIEMKLGNHKQLLKKAREITDQFNLRLERTEGSLALLKNTLQQALKSTHRR